MKEEDQVLGAEKDMTFYLALKLERSLPIFFLGWFKRLLNRETLRTTKSLKLFEEIENDLPEQVSRAYKELRKN